MTMTMALTSASSSKNMVRLNQLIGGAPLSSYRIYHELNYDVEDEDKGKDKRKFTRTIIVTKKIL
jgi:hypothetical protein